MYKKIICILVMMLLITSVLTTTSAMNFQTKRLENDNNYSQSNQNTPANSPGLITIKIVGLVKEVEDPHNLLGGVIKVTDRVRGKYIYDSGKLDSEPDPQVGEYHYTSSTFGIEIKIGGLVFKTNPSNVDFSILILDDQFYINRYIDAYAVTSDNNLQLSNGMLVDMIALWLEDSTCTALSSDALPTTAPQLSDWNDCTFIIYGNNPSDPSEFYDILILPEKFILNRTRALSYLWFLERFPLLERLLNFI